MGGEARGARGASSEASMADTKEEKAAVSPEHLNIKVKQDDSEIVFKIKKTTPLKKLMSAYCARQTISFESVVFLYDGNRIQAEKTPDDLGMEDNDEIDVMMHQIGGC